MKAPCASWRYPSRKTSRDIVAASCQIWKMNQLFLGFLITLLTSALAFGQAEKKDAGKTPAGASSKEVAVIKTTGGDGDRVMAGRRAQNCGELQDPREKAFMMAPLSTGSSKGFMIQGGDPMTKDPRRSALGHG